MAAVNSVRGVGVMSGASAFLGLTTGTAFMQLRAAFVAGSEMFAHLRSMEDVEGCKCRAHGGGLVGTKTEGGCLCDELGAAGYVVSSLKSPYAHSACVVDVATKVVDRHVLRRVVEHAYSVDWGWKVPGKEARRYCKSQLVAMRNFGAGFCYLGPCREGVRARLSRILGPTPLLLDAVAFVAAFPAADIGAYYLKQVASGLYHFERIGAGGFGDAKGMIVVVARIVASEGSMVRVGMAGPAGGGLLGYVGRLLPGGGEEPATPSDGESSVSNKLPTFKFLGPPMTNSFHGVGDAHGCVMFPVTPADRKAHVEIPRVIGLVSWFAELGIRLPTAARTDVALASCLAAAVPFGGEAARARCKSFELLGDRVLSCVAASVAVSVTFPADANAVMVAMQNNAILGRAFVDAGLREYCIMANSISTGKSSADVAEQLFGVVAYWRGMADVSLFMKRLGIYPSFE